MADHRRTVIRDSFVTALTGLTTSGQNVFASRIMPMDDDTLPGLIVYAGAEEVNIDDEIRVARVQERSLNIIVEVYDKLSAGLDDNLDLMISEVETAILPDTSIDLVMIDEPEIDKGLEKPVGRVKMIFRVQYLTADGAPTTAI